MTPPNLQNNQAAQFIAACECAAFQLKVDAFLAAVKLRATFPEESKDRDEANLKVRELRAGLVEALQWNPEL